MPLPVDARMERERDHEQGDRPDRDVHVEDPAPGEVVDEEAAEQWADHGRDAEHGAEVALVLAALARWDHIADHGEGHDDQTARSQALHGPKADQLGHVLAEAAERGADQEDHDRGLEHELAAVEIAELAVERAGDRGAEQIRGDDPREVGDAAEVADDGRQRGRDDRLVERGEQQHEHQREEDQAEARLWLDG